MLVLTKVKKYMPESYLDATLLAISTSKTRLTMRPPRSNLLVGLFVVHIRAVMYTNDGGSGGENSSYSFLFCRFCNRAAWLPGALIDASFPSMATSFSRL